MAELLLIKLDYDTSNFDENEKKKELDELKSTLLTSYLNTKYDGESFEDYLMLNSKSISMHVIFMYIIKKYVNMNIEQIVILYLNIIDLIHCRRILIN